MSSGALGSAVGSPYRGVLPFRYADRAFFFGREKIIEDLYAKILLYRLVLLFGESGAGKSSVINAGIIPALQREGCQAERLRVSPEYENAPILIERIEGDTGTPATFLPSIFLGNQTGTTEGIERIPCRVDEFASAIRSVPRGTIPLLIFDQFEELFTLFSSKGGEDDRPKMLAQNQILETIYELAHDQELEVKILIIIREDFLGKLEICSRKYPQIFDHRVRLGHLDKTEAKLAIVGPFKEGGAFGSMIAGDLADTIVEDLAYHEGQGVVHATQLQIVCDRLWRKYALGRREISENEFVKEGRVKGLLEGYLTSELEKLGAGHRPQAIRILASLITDSNTRDIVSEDKLRNLLGTQTSGRTETLAATLKVLEERRIINRTTQRDNFYYEVASEYLINPINREKQRLVYDARLRKQRNWGLGGLAATVLLGAAMVKSYSIWLETQPWGHMTNLSTGSLHYLTGDLASIGRSTADFTNDISLSPSEISRIHLFVSREHIAVDVRSLNGTTVNSSFLPYGRSRKLKDGDIIALAGIAPFKFSASPIQVARPTSAWAMVIDGKARTHHYLTGESYVLVLSGDGKIIVKEVEAASGLLTIEKTDRGANITDAKDNYDLKVEMRVGDYTYVSCKIPPGQMFDYLDVRKLDQYQPCEVLSGRDDMNDVTRFQHGLSTVTYRYRDTPFQIIPIVPNLESLIPDHS